ncbi:hypothetical protein EIP86_001623 [Pleurotus ostreatoroseus]|nr:hypothetical protein EIP86_001623 [Pleurotus ostreatoroseus]
MSTTTHILFNSPALHSLKRDQLVQLCKHHSLKANGKNTELIDRLKQKATELTELGQLPEEALDENEHDETGASIRSHLSRPSEQWEMVMDDIEEVDELMGTMSSMSTLRSNGTAGEFGTAGSKSSVASSLKAIASSLGLAKRAAVDKSTVASTNSAPAALIAGDAADKTTRGPFAPARPSGRPKLEPIPGNPSRPGMPAPPNARLSTDTGTGMTTTVRLISTASFGSPVPSPPRLTPYQTTFDLDMGTPDKQRPGHSVSVWPASPGTAGRLYPAVPYEDLKPTPLTKFLARQASRPSSNSSNSSTPSKSKGDEMPRDIPDMFSPAKAPSSSKKPAGRISAAQDEPFLFGSPLPQHKMSNKDFGHAAASVLEEMNKRLADAGVKKLDTTILDRENKPASGVFGIPAKPTHKKTGSGDRFAKAHDEAFNKMDSIATHYAARRVLQSGQVAGTHKRKSEALGAVAGPAGKRKSSVVSHTGQRVISSSVRKNMGIPGGFGDEDDDNDEVVGEDAGDRRASKRMRVAETAEVHKGRRVSLLLDQAGQTPEEREKEERRKEREREAIKRKLDESRARRRSRASIGRAPPPEPSRLGFLASAKSIVRNVWNMGAGASKSNAPAPKAAGPKAPAANVGGSSRSHPRVPSGSHLLKPTASSNAKTQATDHSVSSSHSRPPIPSFNGKDSTTSRNGHAISSQVPTAASKASVKPASTTGPSSMGTRKTVSSSSNVTSLGTRKSVAANSATSSNTGAVIDPPAKRATSRLLAPTASSLAKRQGVIFPGDRTTHLAPKRFVSPSSLQPITNSISPRSTVSPRPTKIFSKPLDGFGSPPPEGPQSLGGAASTLLARATENALPQTRPRTTSASSDAKSATLTRKPRISRSRVIAKLGAQRAATTTVTTTTTATATGTAGGSAIKPAPRARSSIGAGQRLSLNVKQNRMSANDMLMSAKKKARQSEYARRHSQNVTSTSAQIVAAKLLRAAEAPQSSPVDVSMELEG